MKAFQTVVRGLAAVPAWIPLLLYPAVLIVYTVLVLVLGGRKTYPYVAVALGAAAFTLLCCKSFSGEAFVFLGLYSALAAVLKLFFFIPPVKRKRRPRVSKDERIYQKFHAELAEKPARQGPPKICRFEEPEPVVSAQECGRQRRYADELLSRLKKASLNASDRLEAEVIGRSLGAYRSKKLTEEEIRALNDCLASLLKLTAKYKL